MPTNQPMIFESPAIDPLDGLARQLFREMTNAVYDGYISMDLAVRYDQQASSAWRVCGDDVRMRDILRVARHPFVNPDPSHPELYPERTFCRPLRDAWTRGLGCDLLGCKPCCDMFRRIVPAPPALADLIAEANRRNNER